MDELDKAVQVIEKRSDGSIPAEMEAIVTDREITTREAIFGSKGKYGELDDAYVTISFDIMYGGVKIDKGQSNIQISTNPQSQLAKYVVKYGGAPEKGQDIKVTSNSKGYWEIITEIPDIGDPDNATEDDTESNDEEEKDDF